jgi:uncharacterized RDD family membrane protein YckC
MPGETRGPADDGHPAPRPASRADRPAASRLLSVGARSAERVAKVTGVDHALNEAVEEAIVRALRSPAVIRAIERSIEEHAANFEQDSDELAATTRRVLESEAAGQVWKEVLESDQAQQLVERVAKAPEVRAAITAQGAGLITDIGIRLTKITEEFDDRLERVVRRANADSETNQAGLATRAVAAAVDIGLLTAAYSLISGVLASIVSNIFGSTPSPVAVAGLSVLGVLVGGAVFAIFWALAGQTPGMRFLSIRLVHEASRDITLKRASRRVFAVVLSLLPLGLGYFAILRDPRRRAWCDRMTHTAVIYDMDARRAPHAGGRAHTTDVQ